MRLIASLKNEVHAKALSAHLEKEGVPNELEITPVTDWGSDDYGNSICTLWISDEELLDKAVRLVGEFQENPWDKKYESQSPPPPPEEEFLSLTEVQAQVKKNLPPPLPEHPVGMATFIIMMVCIIFFILTILMQPQLKPGEAQVGPPGALATSMIEKELYYDYPETFILFGQLFKTYGIEKIERPELLPPAGVALFERYQKSTYWQGFYQRWVDLSLHPGEKTNTTPMFEKLQEGEAWRLLTPIFLHANILHILFNLLWFVLLGRQMEERLKKFRYLFFIVAVGIFSNTMQYLMGGFNFIGISGVISGMIAFLWMRQKHYPWEGYYLQPSTYGFIASFIVILALLQTLSFCLEISGKQPLPIGIANTAHISGALLGFLFGKLSFFSWRRVP